MGSSVKKKLLSCLFLENVLCSFRKDDKDFRVMDKCLNCRHYREFLRIMEEEEDEFWDEVDRIRKYGYPKSKGELV